MGQQVLCAGDASLHVDPADGGRWTSLQVDGLELLEGARVDGVPHGAQHGCFPMAPYAGRTGYGLLVWAGRTYELPLGAAPHAIHGTTFDVPWTVDLVSATHLELSVPLAAPWPFPGTVRQRLVLGAGGLVAELVLQAEQAMPVTLGWHPWFPRRLSRGAELRLEPRVTRQYARGEDGLPTGELVAPLPGPWDDCFLGTGAHLVWPGALELDLTSDHEHWVVFDGLPHVVAVEPQTGPPDAVRLGRATVVPAGGELCLRAGLHWRAHPG